MNKITGFTDIPIFGTHIVINVMGLVLITICGLAMYFFYKGQSANNKFDVFDFFMENGKASVSRLGFMGAFVLTSWVIADREIKGLLDLAFYGAYLAAWVAPLVTRYVKETIVQVKGGTNDGNPSGG